MPCLSCLAFAHMVLGTQIKLETLPSRLFLKFWPQGSGGQAVWKDNNCWHIITTTYPSSNLFEFLMEDGLSLRIAKVSRPTYQFLLLERQPSMLPVAW